MVLSTFRTLCVFHCHFSSENNRKSVPDTNNCQKVEIIFFPENRKFQFSTESSRTGVWCVRPGVHGVPHTGCWHPYGSPSRPSHSPCLTNPAGALQRGAAYRAAGAGTEPVLAHFPGPGKPVPPPSSLCRCVFHLLETKAALSIPTLLLPKPRGVSFLPFRLKYMLERGLSANGSYTYPEWEYPNPCDGG